MRVLGLTHLHKGGFHDSAVALVENGKLIYAEAEERISRLKHDGSLPLKALERCLEVNSLCLGDIDYIAATPSFTSLERRYSFLLGEEIVDFFSFFLWQLFHSPRKFTVENWARLRRQFQLKSKVNKEKLELSSGLVLDTKKIIRIGHHHGHAASAYRSSNFGRCLAVTLDAVGGNINGELICGSVYLCEQGEMILKEEVPVFNSIGFFYTIVTIALGFKAGDGEGKTMGLAAYGDRNKCYKELKLFAPSFRNGSWHRAKYWVDQLMQSADNENLLDSRTASSLKKLIKKYSKKNIAAAAQRILEEEVLSYFRHLTKKYRIHKFAVAGGIFLNVKLNKLLMESDFVDDLFIYPFASDGGTAAGAALEVYHQVAGEETVYRLDSVALGSEFSDEEIETVLKEFGSRVCYEEIRDLPRFVARRLVEGKVVGWFQGRAEWGPRALGQRSVLADPRGIEMKDRVNNVLKRREWFMPFAPSILHEKAGDYLIALKESPFMILADDVRPGKEDIPAAIHVDNTVRPQTVKKEILPLYHSVIKEFYKLTGVPAVLNTSFNRHGLPIVHSPKDAIEHLLWGCVDELFIGPFWVRKSG